MEVGKKGRLFILLLPINNAKHIFSRFLYLWGAINKKKKNILFSEAPLKVHDSGNFPLQSAIYKETIKSIKAEEEIQKSKKETAEIKNV